MGGACGWTVIQDENSKGDDSKLARRVRLEGGDGLFNDAPPYPCPPDSRYHFEDVGGVQGARAVHVLSVQPLCLENLSLRGSCQDAWFLSGKQQVAKENQQVRATAKGMWSGGRVAPRTILVSILILIPLGSKGCHTTSGLASAASVPD